MKTTTKQIKGTGVLSKLLKTTKRYCLSVGSSRSSKTFSMMQWIIIYCGQNQGAGKWISVVRQSMPSLRATVYREFVQLLQQYEIYNEENHNKTGNVIELFGNYIEFFSLSDSQKVRGRSRDILYLNECNEIDYEAAQQLFLRTTDRIFLDENPSDPYHWSFKLQHLDTCDYVHSTYKDNNFLSKATIDQIESYRDTDPDMWAIYGEGKFGNMNNELIYNHQQYYNDDELYIKDEDRTIPIYEDVIWGCDWGYTHPMALVKIYIKENQIWCEEVVHKSNITVQDLLQLMSQYGVPKDQIIYCDPAGPSGIEDLRRAGYNAVAAMNDVKPGIDLIKSTKFNISNSSTGITSELMRYKWRFNGEQKTDEPIKLFDDGLCAIRYAWYTYTKKTRRSNDYDFDFDFIDL